MRIGTSGWEYADWAGRFYPAELSRDRWLERYAAEFDTVELNNSFYRLPSGDQFETWAGRVPERFRFAVKASRYLTHLKRLREPADPLDRLWSRARRMGDRLGPVLYQLPPRWRPNLERLATFVDAIPDASQAIEFRDRRWYREPILEMLRRSGVALCLHDMPGSTTRPEPIGPFAYVRFHGSSGRYAGSYSAQRLSAWADRMARWSAEGLEVWAYFNNDVEGHAVRDAIRLRSLVERRAG